MKNLFKNLMLVAVAAMAFTACTETNDEVNAVTKKVVLEFVADLADDDTRVAFGEKDGNKYPTVWEASDNVTVKVGDKTTSYTLTEEDVLESGKKAIIRPEFELVGDETLSGDIVATVNEYVYFDNHQGNKPTISLKAEAVYPATNLVFEHQYAYGKMELVGLPAEFNVTEVKLNLVGGGNTLNHTINGYSVEDNIFWFTTEPAEVSTFTVTAYDAQDKAITKTVDVAAVAAVNPNQALTFSKGRVSTFSVSGLEAVVAPEEPDTVMDSAKYYYNYNDYGGYDNWGYVVFEDEYLGTLVVNCTFATGLYLDVCTYTYKANSVGVRFDDALSYYNLPGATPSLLADYWVYSNEMIVDVVDGKYSISLDFQNKNGDTLAATYVGDIEGLGYPDLRTQLAAPSNVTGSAVGKTITLSWDAVENVDGYRVKLYSPDAESFEEIVTTNEYVYEAQLSDTMYYFTIMSYASDTNATYRSSEDAYAEVRTEDTDPKMEISESKLSFTADGGEKTFTVTLKNTDAAIEYTQVGDWFTVAFSGDTFTVNASANESETDAREGSITVAAGELSQTITVTQSKKPAASTGGADGKTLDTAYKFTGFKVGSDNGYPVLVFYGAEDGRVVAFEPSGALESCAGGLKKLTDGCWWPHYMFYYESYNESNYDAAPKLDILLDSSYSWIEKTSGGFTLEYFYIVSNGEAIYYKYDGVFNC